ncbi:MAG: hypothetical protein A6F71_00430 [Cycloclasticus sp. symbiont of Poecilosclerida sp. M]|nr:MAG: hypothetical protein A6F71_00430 [Cycloclasticus sp. symbiont of Poecilosclerida sp. M]
MGNRLLLNLMLMVLGSLLLGLIWLTQDKGSEQTLHLSKLDITLIQSITIQRKNQETVELVKAGNEWNMIAPFSVKALSGKIGRLLKISQIKASAKYPLVEDKKKLYGLDQARAQVSFDKTQLTIGKTNPVGQRRYVSDGTSIYLVDDAFLHHLTAPATDYIDTRLLISNSPIIKIETPQYTISQQTDSIWTDEVSPENSLSPDSVQILLDEWRFARAIQITKTTYQPVDFSIKIIFEDNKEHEFLVTKKQNEVYLATTNNNQLSYVFSLDKFNKLTTPPKAADI